MMLLLAVCALLLDDTAAIHAPGLTIAAGTSHSVSSRSHDLPKHSCPLALRGGEAAPATALMLPSDGLGEWGWRDSFDRVVYRLQNVMLSSPVYKFATIIVCMGFFILVGASIIKTIEFASGSEAPQSWNTALFTAYSLIADAPGADAVSLRKSTRALMSTRLVWCFQLHIVAHTLTHTRAHTGRS